MSILNRIFKKSPSEVHMPLPAEYRDDYRTFMERKGISVRPHVPPQSDYVELKPEEPKNDIVDFSAFDALAGLASDPSAVPVQEQVTLESVNKKLADLERILKDRGYI